ncbi:ATP phosphoribosyltransferase (ATP-PRTase) (ATP-PRT) [Phytophthora boehmeriae]|uniref:ATP phosphoribosyltransferase n=1 Tax=Phytophthora boehmeriae TaxID=109152 RepID=A0A8T1VQA2_9STRA|nr:ATP phosphoribosyltransferase (ATP-PRTase) (ATP-PRT) [Phytophthora boehmeriae]
MSATPPTRVPKKADDRLLFAIPKKGRLHDKIIQLIKGAGLHYHRPNRVDIALCSSLPVTLVFLPASDIATYVGEGNLDIGITGQDIIAESKTSVTELMQLGFGKCSLGVQTPVKDAIADPSVLAGKRIVTSFPEVTRDYFKQFETEATGPTRIKYVSGSVEAACSLGLADGIVDLVETGTTMKAAGLELISTILSTQAVLIANPQSSHKDLIHKVHQRILGYITATKYRMVTYNVDKDQLEAATKITPGRRSPTVNTLVGGGYAVSAMVESDNVSDVMDRLNEVGATDIMIFNIENCRA